MRRRIGRIIVVVVFLLLVFGMWKEKHLKSIPKAKVDKNGIEILEIGAHRKGIVQELEKAHIYIEQLHQQNKTLEKRLAKLEARLSEM